MLIGGIQKTTLIDYPDKVAATIFTIGCNFRCSFCHNPDIVKGLSTVIPEESIIDFFKKRKKLLDAVCITGGEPTVQVDLVDFIRRLKDLGLLVKLDTNGTNPSLLKRLIKEKLVDYIAMDIKAPWDKYKKVVIKDINVEKIKESVKIIRESGLDYEFRSTVLPALHSKEDIIAMARQIKGSKKYFLQQFKPAKELVNEKFIEESTYTKKELNEIIEEIKDWFDECDIR